ncbi:MAG: MMPL family transporter, partial [Gaiellaceae bacterium]
MTDDIGAAVMHSRFYRLGSFAYRRRLWVLAVWILIFLAAGGPLSKLQDRLSQGGFEVPGSQSDQVARITERDFSGQFEITDLLVMRSTSLTANDPAFKQAFAKVREALLKAPGVAAVADPYAAKERSISKDGRVLSAIVGITDDQGEALKHNEEVERAVKQAAAGTGVEAYVTGAPPFY